MERATMAVKQPRIVAWDKRLRILTFELEGKKYRVTFPPTGDPSKKMVYFYGEQQLITLSCDDNDVMITDDAHHHGKTIFKSELTSPLTGMIVAVPVSEGQVIRKGDPLVAIEAMKMENVLHAPYDVIIKSLFIQKGDVVHQHQVLMIFDEKGEDGYAGSNRKHE